MIKYRISLKKNKIMIFYNLRSMKYKKKEIIVRRRKMEKYELKKLVQTNIQQIDDLWRSL